ncbi:MAG: carbon storage regulator [Bryobacterales bacterium]|nr:carbon storage regulator [Bryobacteraceae bacterium]MDW8354476.1 carbon storage regulator [Bryobacterales bacterium]
MLVIRRRVGQGLRIGDDVEVTVSEVSGGSVKLAITAPRQTRIVRSEVAWTCDENRRAALALPPDRLAALLKPWRKARGGEVTEVR